MKTYDISSLEKLRQAINLEVPTFSDKQIILLEGPLGSGKTQTARYIIEELGGGEICSPSFAIHNIYQTERGEVDHIDLYRLEDGDDIESTGFWDLFEKPKGLILIEWANYLQEDMIPIYWDRLRFKFEFKSENARSLNIESVK